MDNISVALQFDVIKKDVSNYASFTPSVEAILNEHYSTSKLELKNNLNRTREALRLSNIDGLIPMDNLSDISSTLLKASKGLTLSSVELNNINRQLSTIDAIYSYKKQATINVSSIWELIDSLNSFKTLANEISKVIKDGAILDNASSKLKDIRKSISNTNQLLDEQVAIFIKDNGSSVVDNIVTKRNDRLCILVKASDKNSFNGFIHGESTSGANTYVEPSNLIPLNNAYQSLNSEEANEIQRLLRELSSKVAKEAYQLQANQDTLVVLDVIFAKAKWGMRHRGIVATLNSQQRLMFKDARHPLISEDKVVANSYEITKPIKALLVSGSNTGGKSVTLKTIGLFTLMSMCAYPVLCSEATLPLYDNIFVNVGDEQSIQASLSTFSAHISNLSNIINNATENSLVLLDEIGSGTDPKEGEAIAIAVLEYLLDKVKATIVVTTHYGGLKTYALNNEQILLSSVGFDLDKMKPTYKLALGTAGSSNALEIAKNYGISNYIIEQAIQYKNMNKTKTDELNEKLEQLISNNLIKETKYKEDKKALEDKIIKFNDWQAKQAKIVDNKVSNAKEEANEILEEAKDKATNIINKLKEQGSDVKLHELLIIKKELDVTKEDDKDENTIEDYKYKVGDAILYKKLNYYGEIVTINKKKVTIMCNGTRMNTTIDEIQPTKKKTKTKEKGSYSKSIASVFKGECNVIGMHVEEALATLDKYLDNALVAKATNVIIIHGLGTGALRTAIHSYLKKHSKVESYRTGLQGEGGLGATCVTLKRGK